MYCLNQRASHIWPINISCSHCIQLFIYIYVSYEFSIQVFVNDIMQKRIRLSPAHDHSGRSQPCFTFDSERGARCYNLILPLPHLAHKTWLDFFFGIIVEDPISSLLDQIPFPPFHPLSVSSDSELTFLPISLSSWSTLVPATNPSYMFVWSVSISVWSVSVSVWPVSGWQCANYKRHVTQCPH